MSMYVEQNLGRDEVIVQKAKIHPASVISYWIAVAIFFIIAIISGNNTTKIVHNYYRQTNGFAVFCLVVSIIFIIVYLIPAITKTIALSTTELAVTNKKLVGKLGLINTKSMDAPLNKVQNISVSSGLGGKIFGYGNIKISTASGNFSFKGVEMVDSFKAIIMEQIDTYEKLETQKHAQELAMAMMMNQNNNSTFQHPSQNEIKMCPKCGLKNSAEYNFCKSCGTKL